MPLLDDIWATLFFPFTGYLVGLVSVEWVGREFLVETPKKIFRIAISVPLLLYCLGIMWIYARGGNFTFYNHEWWAMRYYVLLGFAVAVLWTAIDYYRERK